MENLKHILSGKQNLRTERLISYWCLIYRNLTMLVFLNDREFVWGYVMSTRGNFCLWFPETWARNDPGQVDLTKLSWIKFYLYDWTGFAYLGNFQSWSPFVFDFHRLSLNSLLFTFPAHKHNLPQTLNGLTCNLIQFVSPESQVPLFPNKLIFLTILSLPWFTSF